MVTCQSSELGWEVTVELPADFLSWEVTVVQIVTDNGLAFVKARKLLMKKYNLY